jgi:TM2 domain-containing membrane protein YozV
MSEWYQTSGLPDPDGMYIGHADRDEATQLLGEHFRDGRLDADEYGQRLQIVVSARTRGELRAAFAPLPYPWPSCLRPAAPPLGPLMRPGVMPPVLATGPSDKSRVVAGVLQILLPFGIGRFYTGHVGLGVAQLLVVLVTCGFGVIWPIIDGIVLLASGGTDIYGRPLQ